jgi:hypothetical protein
LVVFRHLYLLYKLAISLVDSMKVEVICRNNELNSILNIHPISYHEALSRALNKTESNDIISSWKDSYSSSDLKINIDDFSSVPTFGCLTDKRTRTIQDIMITKEKIWSIGGQTGWYFGDFLWRIRGFIDKIWGGVGLRRGRTNQKDIHPGDALDFWRVLYANKEEGRLLLLAEMKLPGEAWLEFKIQENELIQTATFRPLGLAGRLYWFSVSPLHGLIFNGMIRKLTEK